MATLERIRRRSGLLIVVIGIAMLAFILTDLLGSGGSMFRGDTTTVGKVNGHSIELAEFNARMEEIKLRLAQQNPQQLRNISQKQLADGAWEEILRERIMGEQYDELGFTVTPQELHERLISDPGIRQAPIFQDQNTGTFNEALFNQYITNLRENALVNDETKEQYRQWIAYEKDTRNRTEADKYIRGVERGLYVPAKMARVQYLRNNTNHSVSLLGMEYFSIADSTVKITESDFENYYDEHKEEFKTEATRSIEYVGFNIEPSESDRNAVIEELNGYKNGTGDSALSFAAAEDDSAYADLRSDIIPISPVYYRQDNLPPSLDSSFFEREVGYVTDPYLEGNFYKITKITDRRNLPDSVKARQILIGFAGANNGQSQSQMAPMDAKALADSLLGVLKNDSSRFTELAKQYSEDFVSAQQGGNLGWFDEQAKAKPISDFAFQNDKGDMKVVFSQRGFHIIQILDQKGSTEAIQLISISREIAPSTDTDRDIHMRAANFASEVNNAEVGDFSRLAEEKGYTPRPVTDLAPFDEFIAGLGNNRKIVQWAHEDGREVGDVNVITTENNSMHVVVRLTDIQDEGYAPLKKVKEQIRPMVIQEKKAEQLKARMNKAAEGKSDLNAIAGELGVQVKNHTINFATANIPGYGEEPKVVGAISGMKPNVISKPVQGKRAVYMFSVMNTLPANELPDYNMQKEEAEMMIRPRVNSQIFQSLKEEVNLKDNRARFY